MSKNNIITAIDLGTSFVRVAVVQKSGEDELPFVLGIGEEESRGIRKGNIVDSEEVVSSIASSLEKVERITGMPIEHAFVSISGVNVRSHSSKGVIAVSRADGEIIDNDIERVLEVAREINLPPNREVLHIIPREYVVDNERGIKDPRGMSGIRLEAEAIIIECSSSLIRNLTKCIYRTGVDIDDLVLANLAVSEGVLSKRQKDLGVVEINIGGGSTGITVFEEGSVLYANVLPIGGENITNDLAIGLRTNVDIAEKIKIEFGSCNPRDFDRKEEVDLSKIDKKEKNRVPRYYIAEIITARVSEIFSLIDEELRKIERSSKLPGGAVLTGGTVKLPGIVDSAKEELNLPAQIGFVEGFKAAGDQLDNPCFATLAGLIKWGMKKKVSSGGVIWNNFSNLGKTVSKIKHWFKEFIP